MKNLPKLTKFLLCSDNTNKELYILHREFPACLIWVKQETPVRFIIMDLYDEIDNPNDILEMAFVKEAKNYFNTYIENIQNQN